MQHPAMFRAVLRPHRGPRDRTPRPRGLAGRPIAARRVPWPCFPASRGTPTGHDRAAFRAAGPAGPPRHAFTSRAARA